MPFLGQSLLLSTTVLNERTRIFKNSRFKKLSRDLLLLQKLRKQGIIFSHDILKILIPTFGKHSFIMLTYYNGPKLGIKLLKYLISEHYSLFTFCNSDQSLLRFFNFKFLNILVC